MKATRLKQCTVDELRGTAQKREVEGRDEIREILEQSEDSVRAFLQEFEAKRPTSVTAPAKRAKKARSA
jgi:hypothetical protein